MFPVAFLAKGAVNVTLQDSNQQPLRYESARLTATPRHHWQLIGLQKSMQVNVLGCLHPIAIEVESYFHFRLLWSACPSAVGCWDAIMVTQVVWHRHHPTLSDTSRHSLVSISRCSPSNWFSVCLYSLFLLPFIVCITSCALNSGNTSLMITDQATALYYLNMARSGSQSPMSLSLLVSFANLFMYVTWTLPMMRMTTNC